MAGFARARGRPGSVVVARPADVRVVRQRPGRVGRGRELFLIEAVVQDGHDALVGAGAEVERAGAGPLEARGRVALLQAHEAEAGAVALLGVRALLHDRLHEGGGGWPDGRAPGDEPRGRPLEMGAMRGWHV